MRNRIGGFIALGAAGLIACTDQISEPRVIDAHGLAMDIVSGDQQQARAGKQLAGPLVVRVLNGDGTPKARQIVNFSVTSGGGSVFAGASLTNSHGIAQEWWKLGSIGTNTLEVRAVDSSTGAKNLYATFTAIAEGPVATVTVSPATVSLTGGGTATMSATLKDTKGTTLTGRTITWSSSSTAVATVSSAGLVTARAKGKATITATSEGKSGTAAVTVAASDTTPPGQPGWPTFTTAPVSADTFSVTASWAAGADAASYEWATGTNNGQWSKSGNATSTSVTLRAPRVSNAGGYWFCVRSLDAAQNGSGWACDAYSQPALASSP